MTDLQARASGDSASAIEISEVAFEFEHNREQLPVLSDISLSIPEGSFVTLIGPSGCGKTTLLRLISGLLLPSAGKITIWGRCPWELYATKAIGLMQQHACLLPWRTAIHNVTLPLEIGCRLPERLDMARGILQEVGLAGFERSYPSQLSGGMQHRVALARTLICNPSVLLLDEPFAALDELTRMRMTALVMGVCQQRKQTTILVTHNLREAVLLSDRIVVLTSRPARVHEIIQVPFSRPRKPDLESHSSFFDQCLRVRRLLDSASPSLSPL